MNAQITPQFLRLEDAIAYSGIRRSTLFLLLKKKSIKSHAVGTIRLIDRESLDGFIRSQPQGPIARGGNKRKQEVAK